MSKELEQFGIEINDIDIDNHLFDNIYEAIEELKLKSLSDRFEVVLNNNLLKCKDKLNDYRTILGCRVSYEDLERNISFIVREDTKPSYEELEKRISNCSKYLKAIEDHDFCCDIPHAILTGDYEKVNSYLKRQKESYDDLGYEYSEEMKCLELICESDK